MTAYIKSKPELLYSVIAVISYLALETAALLAGVRLFAELVTLVLVRNWPSSCSTSNAQLCCWVS